MVLGARNLLLDAYKARQGIDLSSRFEQVNLSFGAVLQEADTFPRFVHFITTGAVSTVATMPDGDLIEISFVGNEGFPESLYLLGPRTTARRCVVQVEGTALRMRLRDFQEMLSHDAVLQQLVSRWIQIEGLTVGQIAACNGLHRIEQRLARWVLSVQERIHKHDIPLTQDLLGQLLGARRSSVTQATGNLERAGLINWRRGQITIRDRAGLEAAACSCYGLIRRLYDDIYR